MNVSSPTLFSDLAGPALAVLIRGTLVLAVLPALVRLLRRQSAALRHAVLTAGMIALVLLAPGVALMPAWPVLPAAIPRLAADGPAAGDARTGEIIGARSSNSKSEEQATAAATIDQSPDSRRRSTGEFPAFVDRNRGRSGSAEQTATVPTAAATGRRTETAVSLLLAGLFTGSSLLFVRFLVTLGQLHRLQQTHRLPSAHPVAGEVQRLAAELGVQRPIRCVVADAVRIPSASGLRHGTVLLPTAALDWPAAQRDVVLRHELGHLARRDPLWQAFVELAKTIFWFHPLYWIAERDYGLTRERACDDFVIGKGVTAAEYARQLLTVVRQCGGGRSGAMAVAMASPRGVEHRIRALFDDTVSHARISRGVFAGCLAGACLLSLLLAATAPRSDAAARRPGTRSAVPDSRPVDTAADPQSSARNDPDAATPAADGTARTATTNDAGPAGSSSQDADARTAPDDGAAAGDIIWGPDRDGLQAGARLLAASSQLQPGDPIVIQFLLKNTSREPQSVVLQDISGGWPALGAVNRLSLNLTGSSQRTYRHELQPGQTLRERRYRASVDTTGLPPGEYHVEARSAFWMTDPDDPNRGRGIPHRKPIPLTLGDPATTQWTSPPESDDPQQAIHWGEPVAGLIVGMRLPNGRSLFSNTERIEPQLFLYNAAREAITVDYEIPAVITDWNLHLEDPTERFGVVRLDYTWFTGIVPQISRRLTLEPGESQPLTGIEAPVTIGRPRGETTSETRMIEGPAIQVLPEKTEYQYGDPRRLITVSGDYVYHAAVSLHRPDIADLTLVASAGGIPFQVRPD